MHFFSQAPVVASVVHIGLSLQARVVKGSLGSMSMFAQVVVHVFSAWLHMQRVSASHEPEVL